MQINGIIKLRIPDTKNNKGEPVKHLPLLLKNPIFFFDEQAKFKLWSAKTANLPLVIPLFVGDEYLTIQHSVTKEQLSQRLSQILGDDPQSVLQNLLDKTYKT